MEGQRGQTLLEILLAFSISIMVLSTVILGITTSLSNAQYAKNQGLANSYAQEGMAAIRHVRDSGWSNFHLKSGNYCLPQGAVTIPDNNDNSNCGQTGIVGDIFARSVILAQNSPDCSNGSKATVKVSWTDGKCGIGNPYCHSVELVSCFSNIDQKSNP